MQIRAPGPRPDLDPRRVVEISAVDSPGSAGVKGIVPGSGGDQGGGCGAGQRIAEVGQGHTE